MKLARGKKIKCGLYVPNFGKASDPRTLAQAALEAEKHGWDGFFLWDHLVEWEKRVPITDSFTALAAIAMKTRRIRIGTTLTPLPRLKPWIAARQTATLDQLSNGRLILGVGLGAKESCDYARFGESEDNKGPGREARRVAGYCHRPMDWQVIQARRQTLQTRKRGFPTNAKAEAEDSRLGWRILAHEEPVQ